MLIFMADFIQENMKIHRLKFLLYTVCIGSTVMVQAQSGSLDESFGTAGIVTTAVSPSSDFIAAMVVQPDGKIVVTGNGYASPQDFTVVRYNPDGSLDNSFDGDGIVTLSLSDAGEFSNAIALQSDGKIVVAGDAIVDGEYHFGVVRLNTDGSPDNTFNGSGTVILDSTRSATAVAIQSDGRIVIAGDATSDTFFDFCTVRLNADGSPDTDWGSGGKVYSDMGGNADFPQDIKIQPDGKILVAGYGSLDFGYGVEMIRYNSDGSVDADFGDGGKVLWDVSFGDDAITSIALQPDGKIIAAGYYITLDQNILTLRLNADGTADTDYDIDGYVIGDIGIAGDVATCILLQPDGKILAGGYSAVVGANFDFALVRYTANGTPDATFGTGGVVTTTITTYQDYMTCMQLQSDGKIICGGQAPDAVSGSDVNYALVRYITDLDAGIISFMDANTMLIYPNPVSAFNTLEYTLAQPENMTIDLLSADGKTISTLLQKTAQPSGKQTININISDQLPCGNYFIRLASENGSTAIQITK